LSLHRSGANTTKNIRCVYLAQYSCAPILNRHYRYLGSPNGKGIAVFSFLALLANARERRMDCFALLFILFTQLFNRFVFDSAWSYRPAR